MSFRRVVLSTSIASVAYAGLAACESSKPSSSPDAVVALDASNDASNDASDDAVASDSSAGCVLPGSYGSPGCNECMKRTCCATIAGCEADNACKSLQLCLLACIPRPDAGGCYDDCVATHPDAVAKWQTVEDCWFEDPPFCGVECT